MRVHDGDFAYDIEPAHDPLTVLPLGWTYRVYALRPERELMKGKARTMKDALRKGQDQVKKFKEEEKRAA